MPASVSSFCSFPLPSKGAFLQYGKAELQGAAAENFTLWNTWREGGYCLRPVRALNSIFLEIATLSKSYRHIHTRHGGPALVLFPTIYLLSLNKDSKDTVHVIHVCTRPLTLTHTCMHTYHACLCSSSSVGF